MTATPVPVIDPKIDVYGKDGRTCALADLLEFRAIKGSYLSTADLVDLIGEMGWTSLPERRIDVPEDLEDEAPDPLADQAFSLIEQRIDVLGDRYPFHIDAGRVKVRPATDLAGSPYVLLLAIAIAHAWKVPCPVSPEDGLEFVVCAALDKPRTSARPWLAAVGMGTAQRNGRSFVEALGESAATLGLTGSPNPTPIHTYARDAGVDTLVGLFWGDSRPGNWVLIGQATCGMTETWDSKLTQPKPGHWRGYLQELVEPRRFLAVPHHVDDRFMTWIHGANDGIVVDRLRLALALDDVVEAAAPIVKAVLSASAA